MGSKERLTQEEADELSSLCNDTVSTLKEIVESMEEERYKEKTEMEMFQWLLLNYTQMLIGGTLDWARQR